MKKVLFLAVVALALLIGSASVAFAATGTAHFYSGNDVTAVYGPINAYAEPGTPAWGTTSTSAVLCWKHDSWPLLATNSLARYISNTTYIEGNIAGDTWRWFRVTLNIPTDASNIKVVDSAMTVNSDNADRVWINGYTETAWTDGEVEGAFADNYEWNMVRTYSIPEGKLHAGANYMDVVVRNYAGTSSATGNPTGFIYDFSVNYTYDPVLVDVKPGSDPSAFNWNGSGKVPVAILGNIGFDVHTIDPASVTMNNAAVAMKGKKDPTSQHSYSDVNGDGYMDLVVQIVDTDGDVFPAGATSATIAWKLTAEYGGTAMSAVTDIKLTQ